MQSHTLSSKVFKYFLAIFASVINQIVFVSFDLLPNRGKSCCCFPQRLWRHFMDLDLPGEWGWVECIEYTIFFIRNPLFRTLSVLLKEIFCTIYIYCTTYIVLYDIHILLYYMYCTLYSIIVLYISLWYYNNNEV